jgi:hypothetical protein
VSEEVVYRRRVLAGGEDESEFEHRDYPLHAPIRTAAAKFSASPARPVRISCASPAPRENIARSAVRGRFGKGG